MSLSALTAAVPILLLCAEPASAGEVHAAKLTSQRLAGSENRGAETISHVLRTAVSQLQFLPVNWDGHGGIPPSLRTIDEALAFAARFNVEGAGPTVEPSGDGEINLVWRGSDRYIEVGFDGDGEVSYLIKRDGGSVSFGEFAIGEIPRELSAAITRSTYAVQFM